MCLDHLPFLHRAADHPVGSAEHRAVQRALRSKTLHAVCPGVSVDAAAWRRLTDDEKHRLRVRAVVPRLDGRLVVSHVTALALHGVSFLRPWPDVIHVTDPTGGRGQRRRGVAKHAGPLAAVEIVIGDGLHVTSLVRTCIDIALTEPFEVAVAALDECLCKKLVTPNELDSALAARPNARGRVAARRAIAFANHDSDSGGESWCRCLMSQFRTPRPIQQKAFFDQDGLIGYVDFWFEDLGVIVEFDGDQKYLNPRFTRGRSAAQIALAERKRERKLLALPKVHEVVRVEWLDLVHSWRLRSLLVNAGVIEG